MFYKKNKEQTLSKELFQNPTSEYRGTPFWAWNCELSKDELLWQIEQLKKMGFGGFHMHSRSGMSTRYLSDEFFELIKACVNKAEKEDMLAYLYDEDRWPSGSCGGFVTKNRKYAQKSMLITVNKIEGAISLEDSKEDDEILEVGAYDISLNKNGELEEYTFLKDLESIPKENTTRWYSYIIRAPKQGWHNNESYVDTLSKEAIDKFIELTYESYKKEVGEKFGSVIHTMFTDEPQFSRKGTLDFSESKNDIILPWTLDFEETFKKQYGYSVIEKLPELFWELGNDEVSVARYHYHDHITERFTKSFVDNCGEWCEKNGLLLTGHMMSEECLEEQTRSIGEAMRAYRKFGIPGIDMLCDHREYTTAKQAQSAVHQYGREGMLTELYGVTNWDFDFRRHKMQGDWQAALGATIRVHHLAWVSMKGGAKRDYPASINYQSSWYEEYKYIEEHFARLNTALTRGKPIVKVGVIHPIETYWLHWGPKENTADIRAMLDEQFHQTAEWLLSGLIDFDYISESLLPEQVGDISDLLTVGEMKYSTIIVSGCETLRKTTLEVLEKFKACGGKVIFVGEAPRYIDAIKSDKAMDLYEKSVVVSHSKPQILEALEEERVIDIKEKNGKRTNNLLYNYREDNDGKWLFIAHMTGEDTSEDLTIPYERKIIVNGEYTPVLYDTLDGKVKDIEFLIKEGKTIIYYTFFGHESLLLKLEKATKDSYFETENKKEIIKRQRYLKKVGYTLSEPNVLLLDMGEFKLDDEEYNPTEETLKINAICRDRLGYLNNDTQPWATKQSKITHSVTVRYIFESRIALKEAWLATEDANVCRVIFNKKEIKKEICGYYVDKAIEKIKLPKIKKGKNILEITYPYGERTLVENCFILGDFNVLCEGCEKTIIEKTDKIGFGDIASQGLPFYGANITYKMEFTAPDDCDAIINAGIYRGAIIKVAVDGKDEGVILYSPYNITIENVKKGTHTLELTLFGNRNNTFGALHNTDTRLKWFGPNAWERNSILWGGVVNDLFLGCNEYWDWKYEYNLKPIGIMASPEIKFVK